MSSASFHSGGCHFAFADGSVRFLKDSIDSWPLDPETGWPIGVSRPEPPLLYVLTPGTRLGVDQALSTRQGGEVLDAGA